MKVLKGRLQEVIRCDNYYGVEANEYNDRMTKNNWTNKSITLYEKLLSKEEFVVHTIILSFFAEGNGDLVLKVKNIKKENEKTEKKADKKKAGKKVAEKKADKKVAEKKVDEKKAGKKVKEKKAGKKVAEEKVDEKKAGKTVKEKKADFIKIAMHTRFSEEILSEIKWPLLKRLASVVGVNSFGRNKTYVVSQMVKKGSKWVKANK